MLRVNFKGINPINGGSVYVVKAGDVDLFTLTAVKSEQYADMNRHPLFISEIGSLELLQTKNFVSLKTDDKGERFGTSDIRYLLAKYGHHYVAQIFVTKADYTDTVPNAVPSEWVEDQDAIDEDGSYGLDN